jgi:hypothetical protein
MMMNITMAMTLTHHRREGEAVVPLDDRWHGRKTILRRRRVVAGGLVKQRSLIINDIMLDYNARLEFTF